ncbi:zinc finger MYM-type protein 1-like [Pungitius pungitius]|uniref:zinc finger MYM-type protein 1-like n=1 Tax=Pungitius pungitius TaxID=134920 RepID=UPI002E15F682
MAEKLLVKELGPDRPPLTIKQITRDDKGKSHTRSFSSDWYGRKTWLAGSAHVNALFCFPCLLFKGPGTDLSWTGVGVQDMKHLSEKVRKHENTGLHMGNAMKLAVLGGANVATQLDDGHRTAVRKHNEEVDKNRRTLSKIIDCVKYCGAFELALRGGEESDSSDNPGIFRGLDFVASLDGVLEEHLKTASVFKGMSKTEQNELLECMLSVVKDHILEEVRGAECVAVQAERTTDASAHCQLVLVLRYIDAGGNVRERFFEHVTVRDATADGVAAALLGRLSFILPGGHADKLVAQAYGGSGAAGGGVQRKVSEVYPNARYVHCYAHPLDLVVRHATSHIPGVGAFFADLGGFSAFFSGSPERAAALGRTDATRWDFHNRAVDTVYEHRAELLECCQAIRDSGNFDPSTIRGAGGLEKMLEDENFVFFLGLFHRIMPNVDMLSTQLQKKDIEPVFIEALVEKFTESIQKIRASMSCLCGDSESDQEPKPKKQCRMQGPGEQHRVATEVCDAILMQVEERFAYTQHLISATLLLAELFPQHSVHFPNMALDTTAAAYPVLNKAKLKTELSFIYDNSEFKACSGAVPLYQFFIANDLQSTFSETVRLLRILITTPMTTAEPERCFSTLKRIKTFLRNNVTHDRLNALAMLSMEKQLLRDIPDFNKKVIERFLCHLEKRKSEIPLKIICMFPHNTDLVLIGNSQ